MKKICTRIIESKRKLKKDNRNLAMFNRGSKMRNPCPEIVESIYMSTMARVAPHRSTAMVVAETPRVDFFLKLRNTW